MRLRRYVCLASLAFVLACPMVRADDVTSSGDIVNALDPHTAKKPLTRSFRGIKVEPGKAEDGPPSIDLYINFAFDSADLTADGQISLDSLGKALGDPRLRDYRFLIAGHTDAKGTEEYNQQLSERRAAAVRNYLVANYGIPPDKVESRGYGETKLLDPANPEDGINRRVQIVNLSSPAGQQ